MAAILFFVVVTVVAVVVVAANTSCNAFVGIQYVSRSSRLGSIVINQQIYTCDTRKVRVTQKCPVGMFK